MKDKYLVVRELSHTDRQKTFKVLSRPIADRDMAETWLEVEKELYKGRQKRRFMVLQIVQVVE